MNSIQIFSMRPIGLLAATESNGAREGRLNDWARGLGGRA